MREALRDAPVEEFVEPASEHFALQSDLVCDPDSGLPMVSILAPYERLAESWRLVAFHALECVFPAFMIVQVEFLEFTQLRVDLWYERLIVAYIAKLLGVRVDANYEALAVQPWIELFWVSAANATYCYGRADVRAGLAVQDARVVE